MRSSPIAMVVGVLPCVVMAIGAWIVVDYGIRVIRCALRRTVQLRNWRWLVIPLLVIVAASGWQSRWPLYARFALSRAVFEKAATKWLANTPTTQPYAGAWCLDYQWQQSRRVRIGAYDVETIVVFPDERIVFLMTGGFFRATWGSVYDPDGRAQETAPDSAHAWETRPLAEKWKTYVEVRP